MTDYETEFDNMPENMKEIIWNIFEEKKKKRNDEIKMDTIKNGEKMIDKFIKKKDRENIKEYIDPCSDFNINNFDAGDCIPLRLYNPFSFGKEKKTPSHNIVIYVSSDIEPLDMDNITDYDFTRTIIEGYIKSKKYI
jgi:hypothetical protein